MLACKELFSSDEEQFSLFKDNLPSEYQLLFACTFMHTDKETPEKINIILQSGINWHKFIQLSSSHGLLTAVYNKLSSLPGSVVPDYELSIIKSTVNENRKRMMWYAGELVRITGLLSQAGVRALSLKGPALAMEVFDDPYFRNSFDLDFLVPVDELTLAQEVLLNAGYAPELHFKDINLSRGSSLVKIEGQLSYHHLSRGFVFELHWKYDRFLRYKYDFDELWEGRREIGIFNSAISVLSLEETIIFLAIHGAKHQWRRLLWLFEISELLRINPELNREELLARAEQKNITGALMQAFILAGLYGNYPIPADYKRLLNDKKTARQMNMLVESQLSDIVTNSNNKIIKRVNDRFNQHLYRYRAFGLRYLTEYFLFPGETTYKKVKLPDYLFPLYYLINVPWRMLRTIFYLSGKDIDH